MVPEVNQSPLGNQYVEEATVYLQRLYKLLPVGFNPNEQVAFELLATMNAGLLAVTTDCHTTLVEVPPLEIHEHSEQMADFIHLAKDALREKLHYVEQKLPGVYGWSWYFYHYSFAYDAFDLTITRRYSSKTPGTLILEFTGEESMVRDYVLKFIDLCKRNRISYTAR